MRIALVLAGPYPDLRGSQVLVQQLADGIRGRGHVVHLVTYGAVAGTRPGPHAARIARDLVLVARLWRTVQREAIDLIHAHNYEAAIASLMVGRVTNRPVVYHGHNALAEELPLYFRARLLRRPTPGARPARGTSSVVAALAALAPRLVRLAHHGYPDRLLGRARVLRRQPRRLPEPGLPPPELRARAGPGARGPPRPGDPRRARRPPARRRPRGGDRPRRVLR